MSTAAPLLPFFRNEFPVTERYTYLNHAALGPLPRRTADALMAFVADFRDCGTLAETRWLPVVERTRRLMGELLHVAPETLAFTKNTSQGLAIVAASIPWQRGDVVVTVRGEFPANVYPWPALKHQGVAVRFLEPRQGRIGVDELRAALTGGEGGRARLLAISWVQYSSGFRIDLAAVSALCNELGVLLCLDAIQGVGVLPLDLAATPVDFCAFGGQKWLLAPQGVGVLYVNPDLRDGLLPANVGWLGVAWRDYAAFDYESALIEGAARYEEGTRSLIGLAGLEQSLELLLEVGPERVTTHVVGLTTYLAAQVRERGFNVVTPLLPAHRSGILAFNHPQIPAHTLFERLRMAQIVAAVREGAVRISPHLYNTVAEMDAVVAAITMESER